MKIYCNGVTVQGYYDNIEIKVDNPYNNETINQIIEKMKNQEIQKILVTSYFGNIKSINLDLLLIETEKKQFFHQLNQLDMDSSFEVQKLAINFRKWTEWNKSKVIIDVLESYELQTIVVVHDLFNEIKISDGWSFLDDIISILQDYADTEERWNDIKEFWNNEAI